MVVPLALRDDIDNVIIVKHGYNMPESARGRDVRGSEVYPYRFMWWIYVVGMYSTFS